MQRLCYRRFHLFTMKFLNDLWSLKKAELAFMAEHWGIYLGPRYRSYLLVCLRSFLQVTMTMNYRYRRAQQRMIKTLRLRYARTAITVVLLFKMEFLWKLYALNKRFNEKKRAQHVRNWSIETHQGGSYGFLWKDFSGNYTNDKVTVSTAEHRQHRQNLLIGLSLH